MFILCLGLLNRIQKQNKSEILFFFSRCFYTENSVCKLFCTMFPLSDIHNLTLIFNKIQMIEILNSFKSNSSMEFWCSLLVGLTRSGPIFSCYSFQWVRNITLGGGMQISNNFNLDSNYLMLNIISAKYEFAFRSHITCVRPLE